MLSEIRWPKHQLKQVYSVSSTRSSPLVPFGEGTLGCSSVISASVPFLRQHWANPSVAAEEYALLGLGDASHSSDASGAARDFPSTTGGKGFCRALAPGAAAALAPNPAS